MPYWKKVQLEVVLKEIKAGKGNNKMLPTEAESDAGRLLTQVVFLDPPVSLHVNNFPDVVTKCNVNTYADDVAIYSVSKDVNEVADSLNEDLTHIATWIDINWLKMNISRTQLMSLGGHT